MNERMSVRKDDYKKRMAIRTIALQLIDDCYKGKPSKEAINDFLLGTSQLRDKVSRNASAGN
jgi:hypothetical protein